MIFFMKRTIVALLASAQMLCVCAEAVEPSPSPAPNGGKSVTTQVETPKKAKPVGVQAQDPTQNGRVNTSGALSPINANSIGAGVQFDLTPPKKVAPKKSQAQSKDGE
jgi:hypothetical protein